MSTTITSAHHPQSTTAELTTPNSAYSAYEHSNYLASLPSYTPTSTIIAPLPLDIVLEVLLSIGLVSVGVVASSPQLKPIQWSEWAGQIERQQGRSREGMTEKEAQELPANPFRFLEERRSFVDIRVGRTSQ